MWTFSIFTAVLIFIGFLLLGALAQYLWEDHKRKSKKDWKSLYLAMESEHGDLTKKIKKEQRALIQARNDRDMTKEQLEQIQKQIPELKEAHRSEVTALKTQIETVQQERRDISIQKSHVDKDMEKWKNEFEKLKLKYAEDASEVKAFRSEREKLEAEIVKYKNKYAKFYKESNEFKAELETNREQMQKLRELKRDLRKSTAQNKKFEKDIAYWEQKHYDTHHELAALNKAHEALIAEKKELYDLRNGDAIVIGNMKKQIELFKTKFLDVDEKYKRLVKH